MIWFWGLALVRCDGYVYLLADNHSAGDYSCSTSGGAGQKCSSSCPDCALCQPATAVTSAATGVIYYTKAFVKVLEFQQGRALEGLAFYDNDDSMDCSGTEEYSRCSSKQDETVITAVCRVVTESVHNDQKKNSDGDNGDDEDDDNGDKEQGGGSSSGASLMGRNGGLLAAVVMGLSLLLVV